MRLIPVLMMLFCCPFLNAQSIAIENKSSRDIYPQIDNKLSIVVEDHDCDDLIIRTTNGILEAKGECSYSYFPKKIGQAIFEIFTICDFDTVRVDNLSFQVIKWPKHKAWLGGGIDSGTISLAYFKTQKSISVPIDLFGLCGNIKVNSFRIRLLRGGKSFSQITNHGGFFEIATQNIIDQVQAGDFVIFEDIKVLMPGESIESTLESIYLEII